ncbi:MAG: hypothetical protein VYE68_06645 [Acidobacteriota bacterium]|nr:hypothetical protein [Acidobacteriota bacterium]
MRRLCAVAAPGIGRITCGAGLILLFVSLPTAAELRVGAAAVEITPPVCDDLAPDSSPEQFDHRRACFRWVHLAGFSPFVPYRDDARLATGVHDPLWARALAIQDTDADTVVIVATDLPGLGRKHTGPIRRRVAEHLDRDARVIIHSTHTHSAPDASGYWSTLMPGHNRVYTAFVRDRIFESIATALTSLPPAPMRPITTTHRSCIDAVSHRLKMDSACRLPNINNEFIDATPPYDQFLVQRDQRDPIVRNTRIVAAEFVATETGETIATFVNWHNHPDTLGSANRLISSDYPHFLRQYIERHRGGLAVYAVGTLGNQLGGLRGTPVPLWDEDGQPVVTRREDGEEQPVLVRDGWDKIRSTGYEVANEAVAALDTASLQPDAHVTVRTTRFETPIDNMIHLLGTWSVWHDDTEPEERLRYGWPRCGGVLGCVRAEVSLVEVGDLSLITAPGEIDPAYVLGRRQSTADYGPWGTWRFPAMDGVDRLMPGSHHAVIGSAQDYLSYMVPGPDNVGWWNFDHPNHYEEWVTIGRRFGDDVARAWRELLRDTPAPPTSP